MHGRLIFLLFALAPLGCTSGTASAPPPADPEEMPLTELASAFDAARTGTIEGSLTWDGPVPEVPLYDAPLTPRDFTCREWHSWPNPHAPVVDSEAGGVADVVVFLRGIDPRRSRPWDHAPVRVEARDYQLRVVQGKRVGLSGFVRRGTLIEMDSFQDLFESITGRGADFFSIPFPDPGVPSRRRLDQTGHVELSSGASRFWMRAHLWVDDHPYYTHTDARGRFSFAQVPEGVYEVVCWLPSWQPARHERDADTIHIARLWYNAPVEVVGIVALRPGQTRRLDMTVSPESFESPAAGESAGVRFR